MGVPIEVICCLIAGLVVVLIFSVAFFVELLVPSKEENFEKETGKKSVQPIQEYDIDEMLSQLEQKSRIEESEKFDSSKEELKPIISSAVVEEQKQTDVEKVEALPLVKETTQPTPVVEESKNDTEADFEELLRQLESEISEAKTAEAKENVVEVKESNNAVSEVVERETNNMFSEIIEKETVKVVEVENPENEVKPVIIGPEFDYNVRIATINDSLTKIEKDLQKASRDVSKFEKMQARKERNEKLLDRKSAELANLNLVLYNVNNISDIDPEKKKKQEDLVDHISELKSSIKTAEDYLKGEKEKYSNSKKIKNFLTEEKSRYEAEIAELEQLIAEGKKKNKN